MPTDRGLASEEFRKEVFAKKDEHGFWVSGVLQVVASKP